MTHKSSASSRKSKKELDTEFERIRIIGEGTVTEAREVLEIEKRESDVKRDIVLEEVDKGIRNAVKKLTYYKFISSLLFKRIYAVVDLRGFTFRVEPGDKGIVLELYKDKRMWRIAFTPSGIAKYDLNAVEVYTMRVENTIHQFYARRENTTIIDRGEKRTSNQKDSGTRSNKEGTKS
jgi:hypothetical protein